MCGMFDHVFLCSLNEFLEHCLKSTTEQSKSIPQRVGTIKIPTGARDISWLYVWFTSRWRIFHSNDDVTIVGCKCPAKLGMCSVPKGFEQRGIFIVPHLLWHVASVFAVSSDGSPLFSCLLRQAMGIEKSFYPRSSMGSGDVCIKERTTLMKNSSVRRLTI